MSSLGDRFYANAITSSLSESAGCLVGGVLILGAKVTTKRLRLASCFSNLMPAIGGLGLLMSYYG